MTRNYLVLFGKGKSVKSLLPLATATVQRLMSVGGDREGNIELEYKESDSTDST